MRARLLADESLRGQITAGLRRHHPGIDLLTARDAGLESWPDPSVLAWAAQHGRAVVAEDRKTMIGFAHRRLERALPFCGLIVVSSRLPVRLAIRDIASLVARSETEPLDGQIRYVPIDKAWRVGEETATWAAVLA